MLTERTTTEQQRTNQPRPAFLDEFASVAGKYSTAPLWVWNDDITDQAVLRSLRSLAAQGIRHLYVHARPGLMTPYLSDEWFRLWRVAVVEAKALGIRLSIYDENSYPSGFAGGHVVRAMPESRGLGLTFGVEAVPVAHDSSVLGVYRPDGSGGALGESSEVLVARRIEAPAQAWHGGMSYVNLLRPGVTQKFLEITLDAHRRELGDDVGRSAREVFTDEPQILPAGGLPWSDDLPERFEQAWGYSLIDCLSALHARSGDWRKVRHNYFQVLSDAFIENWAKPYFEYCDRHHLCLTGHYWEHDWPVCVRVPDTMAMLAWMHQPGIDTLTNRYSEDLRSQFGNVRTVRELASVANQLGMERTLCEAYGAAGWELRLEDMKRIGDWLIVLGVNVLDQHYSCLSIRGARKRDHPPTFSSHAPWWEDYGECARYISRLCCAMTQGQQINDVLLVEPTTTAWMYNTADGDDPELTELGQSFENLVRNLEREQVEYDIGCESIMRDHGSVEAGAMVVGRRRYSTVVLPPKTENLNSGTVSLLRRFLDGGGRVLCCGDVPSRVDGAVSDSVKAFEGDAGWIAVLPAEVPMSLRPDGAARCTITPDFDAGEKLLHHRRETDDGQVLLLVNTDADRHAKGRIEARAGGVQVLSAVSGHLSAYPFIASGDCVTARFDLPPCGSLLLHLPNAPCATGDAAAVPRMPIRHLGRTTVARRQPNVITLDYVDVTAGGQSLEAAPVHRAGAFVFRQHGFDGNPWNCAVQHGRDLIDNVFHEGSGFDATYRFTVRGEVPRRLEAAIERAADYQIECNGLKVDVGELGHWIDPSFQRVDIRSAARVGENTLTIRARPMTMYGEVESVYLLGDFAAVPCESGFAIEPARELDLGPWNKQGMAMYSHDVAYTQEYNVAEMGGRFIVSLPSWHGSVARVSVNGARVGTIWHQPWECEVSSAIRPGRNKIEVDVVGTLKNALGPHHGNPELGLVGPSAFDAAPDTGPPPGSEYATVAYGLFEPFVLLHENV